MEPLNAIRELTFASMLTRIAVSIVLGAILGVERGLKNRPAGLRTYILVCMGACIIMLTNQYVYMAYNTGDPVRMAAQVVSGIGFLGAGSIIVTKQNQIRGLTTAAGLWAASAVGLAIGIGLYEAAVIGGFSILVILRLLNHWDIMIRQRTKNINLYVELRNGKCLVEPEALNSLGFRIIVEDYAIKAAMFGMLYYGKKTLEDGNTVFHDTHTYDGILKPGEDYHVLFSFWKTWLPMEDEFNDLDDVMSIKHEIKG